MTGWSSLGLDHPEGKGLLFIGRVALYYMPGMMPGAYFVFVF